MTWKLNTSNAGKLLEYQKYLGEVESISKDLPEPDSDLVTIIRFKASQFEGVLVDDVAFEVSGANIGAHIRWKLNELDKFVGRSATFICLLGIHRKNKVEIFRGEKQGTIVTPRGDSFGFNPYFLPEGASKTFGEEIQPEMNPRFMAIQSLKASKTWRIERPLKTWDGNFQKH